VPRAWHAGQRVTQSSVVSLPHGDVFTAIPLVSWSGRGPGVGFALFHNSLSTGSGVTVPPGSGFKLGKGWTHSYVGMVYSPTAESEKVNRKRCQSEKVSEIGKGVRKSLNRKRCQGRMALPPI